jgi:hypothetical protein
MLLHANKAISLAQWSHGLKHVWFEQFESMGREFEYCSMLLFAFLCVVLSCAKQSYQNAYP